MESHGASSLHNTYMMDGLSVDNASGDGSDNINYYMAVSNQETVIETSGGTAEAGTGGVRLNMIPRDGGNRFCGSGVRRRFDRGVAERQFHAAAARHGRHRGQRGRRDLGLQRARSAGRS